MSLIEHPYLRDGFTPAGTNLKITIPRVLADVNPADTAVARMRAKVMGEGRGTVRNGLPGSPGSDGGDGGDGGDGSGGGAGSSGGDGVSGGGGGGGVAAAAAVAALKTQVEALQTKIDGAGITAECNEDGTITVTLSWGS